MKVYSLILIWFLLESSLTAQNLLNNPGFEELTKTPKIIPKFWSIVNKTPDFFYPGSSPLEVMGSAGANILPHSGDNYMGLSLHNEKDKQNANEIAQGMLKEPMTAGKTYVIKAYSLLFYYPLCQIGVNDLQVYFSNQPFKITTFKKLSPSHIQISTAGGWQQSTSYYTAKGGERYIAIGNYSHDYLVKELKSCNTNDKNNSFVYCFLDDIVIEDSLLGANGNNLEADIKYSPGTSLVLRNISFKENESVLLQESFSQLDELVKYLGSYPDLRIEIGGHTDSKGSVEKNISLSEERAKTVANYLVSKGISPSRLEIKGYGSSKPIKDNQSEEGRIANRRVEIKVLN